MSFFCLLFINIFGNQTHAALSYDNPPTVCAEVRVQDKSSTNCDGKAEFKEMKDGKFSLVVSFKVGDFEIDDPKTKQRYEKNIKKEQKKVIVFETPEFTANEWTEKLKGTFQLLDTRLIIGKNKVPLTDTIMIKKHDGENVSYQVDAVVPVDKADFIKLPSGLKGTTTSHLMLIVPQTEIKGTKF
jgi:hypothetical protein